MTYHIAHTPTVSNLLFRRAKLQKMVQRQIAIATDLTHTAGYQSMDATCAWDVVEELSRKLHIVTSALTHATLDPLRYRDEVAYDEELAMREYDV